MYYRFTILFISLFISSISVGQNLQELDVLEVYDEKTEEDVISIYADNKAHCPITVMIDFPKKKNVTIDVKLPHIHLIPANSKKLLVMTVKLKRGVETSFQYGYTYFLGDTKNAKHEDEHLYKLPFEKGTSILLGQGYKGRFSHANIMALDFNLDKGSKIFAARGGTVSFVKADSNKGCRNKSCRDDANYIIILHDDGSFGQYVHLQLNGAAVKEGQKVKEGDLIGHSGNTGWSSGPHLHFEVFVPQNNYYMTVPTKFKTAEDQVEYLEEGKTYQAWE